MKKYGMKKFTAGIFACGMAAAVTFGGFSFISASNSDETSAVEEPMEGGWSTENTETIPEEARDALTKALDGLVGVVYEPIQLLSSQVVAGMNYAFLCRATGVYPDAVPNYCVVTVYADLEGNASLEEVEDLLSVSLDSDGNWLVKTTKKEGMEIKTALERIGYTYYDFDSDGKKELVIKSKEAKADGWILGVYTQKDNQIVSLFSSEENSRFYITDLTGEGDYAFYSIGDTAADQYEYKAYTVYDKTLKISQAVRYDAGAENPWMMGYEENGELVYRDIIDEETGKAIIETAENYKVLLE